MSPSYFRPWTSEQEASKPEDRLPLDQTSAIKLEDEELEFHPSLGCSSPHTSSSSSASESDYSSRPPTSSSSHSTDKLESDGFLAHGEHPASGASFFPGDAAAAAALSFVQQQSSGWSCYSNPFVGFPVWMANGEGGHVHEAAHRIQMQDAAARQARKIRPKRFACPNEGCKKAFSNNGQLIGHKRIHTGERPFQCEIEGCKKAFTRNEELTRHKRIHTGERPYNCEVCKKKFGRKDHLKKHLKTHERQIAPALPLQDLSADVFSLYSAYPYQYYGL